MLRHQNPLVSCHLFLAGLVGVNLEALLIGTLSRKIIDPLNPALGLALARSPSLNLEQLP
jgi:hypothetical protein